MTWVGNLEGAPPQASLGEPAKCPLAGHLRRRQSGPGVGLCPQYLLSRRNFMHRSERRQVP
jgi:hypothetical protein